MELWEFPRDVQDLSVTVASDLGADEVLLIEDPHNLPTIEEEMFQVCSLKVLLSPKVFPKFIV